MSNEKIFKTTQEQALAAWIDYLNQIRLDRLTEALLHQDVNLNEALSILKDVKSAIQQAVIDRNRGDQKGMHGFIAERLQVAFENVNEIIKGFEPTSVLLDNNGPIDYTRGIEAIQQKCVQQYYGIGKIAEHLKRYPNFLHEGGKYQIPKDYYEKVIKILSMTEQESHNLTKHEATVYKLIKDLKLSPENIEPMEMNYADVQLGRYENTLKDKENDIRNVDKQIRNDAYNASKPSAKEGIESAAVGAALEGIVEFCLATREKLKSGKKINEFTADDWGDIAKKSGTGFMKGGARGGAIYIFSNYTATPAYAASSMVTAILGVIGEANKLRVGTIDESEFMANCQVICLDSAVSATASMVGQIVIPIPVLGAIIGNITGMFLYEITKNYCYKKEQELIGRYREDMFKLNKQLDEQYKVLIDRLEAEIKRFHSLLEWAFAPDTNKRFTGSIRLAAYVGVEEKDILKTKKEIDDYFIK